MINYTVKPIKPHETHEWLKHKHYAHRIPNIMYAVGLYDGNELIGICTFGMPPNYIEMKAWEPYKLLELNRLCINEGLPNNTLSFFVSRGIKLLPKPRTLISYSDQDYGHHGYIYQATNWVYTGIGGAGSNIYVLKDGTEAHQRHGHEVPKSLIEKIIKTTGKHRYYYFHGNRTDCKNMKKTLRFPTMAYPKGDNKRYDATYEPAIQRRLI